MRSGGSRARALSLLAAALVVAACGTRLPDEAFAPDEEVISVDDGGGATSPDRAAASSAGSGDTTSTTTGGGDAGNGDGSGRTGGGGTDGGDSQQAGADGPESGSGSGAPNQASDVGITEDTIRIGNITAESGVLGDTFAPAVRGLRAWVQATNAAGGIGGRQIELFTCDDREDRARVLECARRLVEQDEVFALLATNTRAMGGAAQYLSDQGVPVMGFPINNAFYRYPEFFTIYGTAYEREGESVGLDGEIVNLSGQFRWLRENLEADTAGVFYYDIAESSQAGNAFAEGLRAEGFDVTEYVVSFAAPSFDQAVADMERRDVDVIYDAMDPGANRRLCDAMAGRDFTPAAKVSTVVIMGEEVSSAYNDACRNVMFVPTESKPYSSGADEVVEFREAYARYQPGLPLHQWALEAWATGNIAKDAISSMGPAPTREGFIEFLNTMEPNTGEGIMVGTVFTRDSIDYEADTERDCFAFARWLDSEGGWVSASSPFPFCYPDAKTVATPAAEQGN